MVYMRDTRVALTALQGQLLERGPESTDKMGSGDTAIEVQHRECSYIVIYFCYRTEKHMNTSIS